MVLFQIHPHADNRLNGQRHANESMRVVVDSDCIINVQAAARHRCASVVTANVDAKELIASRCNLRNEIGRCWQQSGGGRRVQESGSNYEACTRYDT
jgi:hypothetical protein